MRNSSLVDSATALTFLPVVQKHPWPLVPLMPSLPLEVADALAPLSALAAAAAAAAAGASAAGSSLRIQLDPIRARG